MQTAGYKCKLTGYKQCFLFNLSGGGHLVRDRNCTLLTDFIPSFLWFFFEFPSKFAVALGLVCEMSSQNKQVYKEKFSLFIDIISFSCGQSHGEKSPPGSMPWGKGKCLWVQEVVWHCLQANNMWILPCWEVLPFHTCHLKHTVRNKEEFPLLSTVTPCDVIDMNTAEVGVHLHYKQDRWSSIQHTLAIAE